MPAWATKMVALPFGFSIRNELFARMQWGARAFWSPWLACCQPARNRSLDELTDVAQR
jgi:hypothetical protein